MEEHGDIESHSRENFLTISKDWMQKILLWLTGGILIALMFSVVVDVIMWSLFKHPMVALSELQWHFYGFIGMMGMSYTMLKGAHVRVDIIYDYYPELLKKVVETVANFIFLIPLCVFLIIHGLDLVESSLRIHEKSAVEGGLSQRWIPKAFLPLGATVLILSAIVRLSWLWFFSEEDAGDRGKG